MRIYLAGPMSYMPGYNYAAFDKAAARLRAAGHEVFSPADNDREKGYTKEVEANGVSSELKRRIILDDLTYICTRATAIAFLPGWDGSSIPPIAEENPYGLPGLMCNWKDGKQYACTWAGSAGAKIESALADWIGDLTRIDIPREWIEE